MKSTEHRNKVFGIILGNLTLGLISAFWLVAFANSVDAQSGQAAASPQSLTAAAASRPRRAALEVEVANSVSNLVPAPVGAAEGIERRVFQLVNDARLRNGLPALTWDQELCQLARTHSQSMARGTFFSHENPEGQGPKERAVQAGIRPFRRIAENIAYNWGVEDPATFVIERWMNSPGHRENILGKQYKDSAIGVFVKPNGAVYITQEFISR